LVVRIGKVIKIIWIAYGFGVHMLFKISGTIPKYAFSLQIFIAFVTEKILVHFQRRNINLLSTSLTLE
jgi:hypothetical protein